MSPSSKQISLKPQDLLILLKIASHPRKPFTYASLGIDLGISASETHSSLRRAGLARLVFASEEGIVVQRTALRDFVLFGAKYCFPASVGAPTSGMPTSYAAAPLRDIILQSDDLPPVWPQAHGPVKGAALYPLYPTVPLAASRDEKLYECLALFDALRAGAAREREQAQQLLSERL